MLWQTSRERSGWLTGRIVISPIYALAIVCDSLWKSLWEPGSGAAGSHVILWRREGIAGVVDNSGELDGKPEARCGGVQLRKLFGSGSGRRRVLSCDPLWAKWSSQGIQDKWLHRRVGGLNRKFVLSKRLLFYSRWINIEYRRELNAGRFAHCGRWQLLCRQSLFY